MSQGFSEPGKKDESKPLVLMQLHSRGDLPPRARAVLGSLLDICRTRLGHTINEALEEFNKELHRLYENSRSNEHQQNYLLAAQELLRVRALIAPRFFDLLEDGFCRFDQHAHQPESEQQHLSKRGEALSLVESGELEESISIQDFVSRSDAHNSLALYILGHRFAVLGALPALEANTVPVGPVQISVALRHASSVLNTPTEHRILFYQNFAHVAVNALSILYDRLNEHFVEQHVLRHLRAQNMRRKRSRYESATADDVDEMEAAAARADPRARGSGIPGAPVKGSVSARQPSGPRATTATHDPHSLADERDAELFQSLRELLAGSRTQSPQEAKSAANPTHGSYVPSFEDVQAVLGALQNRPAAKLQPGVDGGMRSVVDLKRDLMQELRELSPGHQAPQLRAEDGDTIDLVGMLFDHMAGSMSTVNSTRHLLTRLEVPMLRVAMRDKSFFTSKSHPARKLLNTIAETLERWIDGTVSNADRDLLQKMLLMLDRVNTEYDGDLGVIEDVLGNLNEHLHTLTRKAEVAERRQVDAAVGREKLALAREMAASAVSSRLAANPPGVFVRTLLEQAWADVLALTLLRQGEASEDYRKRIEVADRLIETSKSRANGSEKAEPANEELRGEIESGLSQIGYHEADIQAVVKRLFVAEDAANEAELMSATELAGKLSTKTRLGKEGQSQERPMEAAVKRRAVLQLDPAEQKTLDELKTLRPGAWFEFITNQQGDRVRKKMAWFSKLTGNCMFVNQRGTRIGESTLEELARDMVRGQVLLVETGPETFVDRAWNSIVASLKRLGTIVTAFAPPPREPMP